MANSIGCHSGRSLTRSDIPSWFRVDDDGRIWTSHNLGGFPCDTERRAERPHLRGYLTVRMAGSIHLAHRIVYAWHYGTIPAGALVRHLNGNRTDNRPSNLALGTNQDNMDDRARHGTQRTIRGEANNKAKLTAMLVRELRALYATGTVTQTELAERYGLSQSSMSSMLRRDTWAHVH